MGRAKSTVLEAPMPLHDFWKWTEEKKRSRGMSYQDMVDAGKKVGVTIDRSTIKQAIKFNRRPSTEMLALIAAAFDVPIAEVYKAAEIFTEIPRDAVYNRPLIVEVMVNAQRMTDAELKQIIALQKTMIAQKKEELNGRLNSKSK